uniref:Eukaryotic translation initiation factor 5 n=1 Tax=Clandestinovirus TaxID=2831644 RepID=A0A8F8PQZ4_9VIRU|nr:eukaryotic translation initiation factor 5 [Clandestinovirus]
MSLVNIPQHSLDPFARYKRNLMSTSSQKSFTILSNFATVCAQVYRSPEYICGLLKKTLATSGSIEKDGSCKLRGNFSWQTIDDSFEKIINDFILCATCGNPETMDKRSKITCKACGHIRII